jgi:hypothetical protein
MKKTFGLIALLACSSAVMVSPALANGRDDFNYRNAHTTYVVDRDRDRHDNDRDRDWDRRDNARYHAVSYINGRGDCR